MNDVIFTAFLLGLLSACSLPLGTLTSAFWKPSDRWIAFLMSFGGGALLAALTIDLAAPSVEKGHFLWLALGCVAGSCIFILLDQLVAQKGGFLRKFSSTVLYLRRKESERFRNLSNRIRRIELFDDLSKEEATHLAETVTCLQFRKGSWIFREGDPGNEIYVIEEGAVELHNSGESADSVMKLKQSDAFGHMACLTGSLHAAVAIASEDCRLLRIPRDAVDAILKSSDEFREATANFLDCDRFRQYLSDRQRLSPEDATRRIAHIVESLKDGQGLPAVVSDLDALRPTLEQVGRVTLFQGLPENELGEIARHCFVKLHEPGHTFFHAGENADRLYVVVSGEVALIERDTKSRSQTTIQPNEAFGMLSFLTGHRHSVNAVATRETTVVVLSRHDFNALVKSLPTFAAAIQNLLQSDSLAEYLRRKHHFTPEKASSWVRSALNKLERGKALPSASDMTVAASDQHGAPLAIWLGILLDGVPESLVIGASLLKHPTVSFSLIAGLFLSNYPEALSSSVGMRQQGMKFGRVFLMWGSLMVLTGIGAALGAIFFQEAPPGIYSLVEGVAAGAMLTMIAQTMLPEAYLRGGGITGFSTLLGFLAALFFKTLEGGGGH